MYRYVQNTKEVTIKCKICNEELKFNLPDNLIETSNLFPIPYRYVHGTPLHSATVYIDKNFQIRGTEFGDALTLSSDILESYIKSANLSKECEDDEDNSKKDEAAEFFRTMVKSFATVIRLFSDKQDEILFNVGKVLGESYEQFFKSTTENELLKELSDFWNRNDLGTIKNVEIKEKLIIFEVFDCFECTGLPNINDVPMCKMDEGFLQGLFNKKLEKSYKVVEVGCIACGDESCKFEVTR